MKSINGTTKLILATALLSWWATSASAGINEWSVNGPEIGSIRSLAVSPYDPDIRMTSLASTMFRWDTIDSSWEPVSYNPNGTEQFLFSANNPALVVADDGYISTDGGRSFAEVDGGLPQFNHLKRMAIADNDRLIGIGSNDAGLWISDDLGETWQINNQGLPQNTEGGVEGVFRVVSSPSLPSRVFAVLEDSTVYRSNNSGDSWQLMFTLGQDDFLDYLLHSRDLVVHPTNPDRVFIDGGFSHFRSLDGGETWARIAVPATTINHTTFQLESPNVMFASKSFAEILRSIDFGKTWQLESILTSSVRNVTIGLNGEGWAGTNTGVSYRSSADNSWDFLNSGLFGNTISRWAIGAESGDIYAATSGPGIFKSSDSAESFEEITVGCNRPIFTVGGCGSSGLDVATTNEQIIFIGSAFDGGLYRSTDGGQTWEATTAIGSEGASVAFVEISDALESRIYAYKSNELYVSDDSGTTWTVRSPQDENFGSASNMISHPTNPNILFLELFNGFIFRSLDAGLTWDKTNLAPESDDVWSLQFSNFSNDRLYAVSDGQVFRTDDLGETWSTVFDPAPFTFFRFAEHSSDPDIFYASAAFQRFYRSTDGGQSWEYESYSEPYFSSGPNAFTVRHFIPDPKHPGRVFGVGSNPGVGSFEFARDLSIATIDNQSTVVVNTPLQLDFSIANNVYLNSQNSGIAARVKASIEVPAGVETVLPLPTECEQTSSTVSCSFNNVSTNSTRLISLTVQPVEIGTPLFNYSVDTIESELAPDDNTGSLSVQVVAAGDSDGDTIANVVDNCINSFNPDQTDTDLDGYGNLCDADFDQTCTTNFADLSSLANAFGSASSTYDLNGDGTVNFLDLSVFRELFLSAPGPSALTTECTVTSF